MNKHTSSFPFLEVFEELWPITRSITGEGVRETLRILGKHVPIDFKEVSTGTKCFDWTVPKEWNIRDGFVMDSKGKRVVDFKENNLHVLNYSIPVNRIVQREELLRHIHSLPEQPDLIPYRTSYYNQEWGFCIQHNRLNLFFENEYQVLIDSSLQDGSLTIGEGYIKGHEEKEVFFTAYACHPSLANNELSGPILLTALYKAILELRPLRYSYRFVYAPETIGAIVYLSQNLDKLKENMVAGYILTQVGIDKPIIYRKSRLGSSLADRVALNVLRTDNRSEFSVLDWNPHGGSDQRQYCSLGVNLPVGYFARAYGGNYPEYHTSGDTISIISIEKMEESLAIALDCVNTLENNAAFENEMPFGEPQLGKRGLHPTVGGPKGNETIRRIKYLLGYSDGKTDLLEIADKVGTTVSTLMEDADLLVKAGLLKEVSLP